MEFSAGPLDLATPDATEALARHLAPLLQAGDVLLLEGEIGAGKSTFARALIRARLNNPAEDVPSPTFTIVQTYADTLVEIWHCDLYRISHPQEVIELGLDEAFTTAICLVEWPDRLGPLAPVNALHLAFFAGDASDGHTVTLAGPAPWRDRLTDVI